MKYYLYRHIRLDKNEPFYVGVGTKSNRNNTTFKTEYSRAYRASRRNKIWNDITIKTEYEVDIVIESDNYDFIRNKEIEFVKLYGRINLQTGTLANLTEGGDGNLGYTPTEEQRKAISERQLGNKNHMFGKKGELNPLFGKPKDRQSREKSANTKHEKYFNEIVDIKTGEVFRNPRCTAEVYNINLNTLRHYLNGTRINPTNLRYKNK